MSEKPHILFVDDESNILQGMRRGLHSRRKDWKMSFALGPHEALDVLNTKDVDIIVTDMRMPDMDGAELLTKTCEISPDTARVVLSGYSKDDMTMRAVGPAHQYLAKPCDFDILTTTLERLITLREKINNKKIRSLITGMQTLPSLPHVYENLINELENPASTNRSIAEIIAQDLGLRSQILKVCNSAFFGLPQHVDNLETAVSLLGLNTLRSMVLLSGIFKASDMSTTSQTIMEKLCSNSLQIAAIAQLIGKKSDLDSRSCDLISCAGTLSHIGSLIIATIWPHDFLKAIKMAEDNNASIDQYEREIIGVDHAAIGAYFLGLWGFPLEVCEAVAFHHRPELTKLKKQPVLACLHISQHLTKIFAQEKIDLALLEGGLDHTFLASQGLTLSIDEWSDIVETNLKKGAA
ncbi:MAG: HDOD domain-containing protein [Terasakiella sp.]|uniref:HDOD domain-containing protein n=1 Tax=unclassified Terasakiella TaxID=2614952 RepID=UPI003B00AB2E